MNEGTKKFCERVGYTPEEMELFQIEGHRSRHCSRLLSTAPLFSITAEVVKVRNCSSGYETGEKFVLDMDGNFITKLCPKKICVYLVSQFAIPVALINERLSEGHAPGDFHFMRQVRCLDVGVECLGYGEVMVAIGVVPRIK